MLVRTAQPIRDPAWTVSRPTLEDVVLAYMERRVADQAPSPRWRSFDDMARVATTVGVVGLAAVIGAGL